jgi:hypothetical protein
MGSRSRGNTFRAAQSMCSANVTAGYYVVTLGSVKDDSLREDFDRNYIQFHIQAMTVEISSKGASCQTMSMVFCFNVQRLDAGNKLEEYYVI